MENSIGSGWFKEGLDAILDFVNLLEKNEESECLDLRARIFKFLESSNEDYMDVELTEEPHVGNILRICYPYRIILADNKEVLEVMYKAIKEGVI